jgi:hypothetical protein
MRTWRNLVELLASAQTLTSFSKPTNREYKNVRNYFANNEPLLSNDMEYIYVKEDLITIKTGRPDSWLDIFVEKLLQKIGCLPINVKS